MKIALLLALVAFGAFHQQIIAPRLQAWRLRDVTGSQQAARRFRISIFAELGVSVLVLLAAAWGYQRLNRGDALDVIRELFAFGAVASLWDVYPYGGTRHSTYLVLFATAGISFLIATIVRQRLLPILLLAVLVVPCWYLSHWKGPQQMERKEQAKELMEDAIADLRTSVQPSELVFSDYQASTLVVYYVGRENAAASWNSITARIMLSS